MYISRASPSWNTSVHSPCHNIAQNNSLSHSDTSYRSNTSSRSSNEGVTLAPISISTTSKMSTIGTRPRSASMPTRLFITHEGGRSELSKQDLNLSARDSQRTIMAELARYQDDGHLFSHYPGHGIETVINLDDCYWDLAPFTTSPEAINTTFDPDLSTQDHHQPLQQQRSHSSGESSILTLISSDRTLTRCPHYHTNGSGSSCKCSPRAALKTRRQKKIAYRSQMIVEWVTSVAPGRSESQGSAGSTSAILVTDTVPASYATPQDTPVSADMIRVQGDDEPTAHDTANRFCFHRLVLSAYGPVSPSSRAELRLFDHHGEVLINIEPRWLRGRAQVESQLAQEPSFRKINHAITGTSIVPASAVNSDTPPLRRRRDAIQPDLDTLESLTAQSEDIVRHDEADFEDAIWHDACSTTGMQVVEAHDFVEPTTSEETPTGSHLFEEEHQDSDVAQSCEMSHGSSDCLIDQYNTEIDAIAKLDATNALADEEIAWLMDLKKENEMEREERVKRLKSIRDRQRRQNSQI